MLPFIPALLLLALYGPSGLEKLSHDGRLPKALRELERAWSPDASKSSEADPLAQLDDKQRALHHLAAFSSDLDFSRAVWSLFQETFEVKDPESKPCANDGTIREPNLRADHLRIDQSIRNSNWESRWTRAGPGA